MTASLSLPKEGLLKAEGKREGSDSNQWKGQTFEVSQKISLLEVKLYSKRCLQWRPTLNTNILTILQGLATNKIPIWEYCVPLTSLR
jgi:hypothetical protein